MIKAAERPHRYRELEEMTALRDKLTRMVLDDTEAVSKAVGEIMHGGIFHDGLSGRADSAVQGVRPLTTRRKNERGPEKTFRLPVSGDRGSGKDRGYRGGRV